MDEVEAQGKTIPKGRYVYLMKNSLGLYKIGISNNVDRRRLELQNTSGLPVELITSWYSEHALRDEQFAHKAFSDSRTHGEWFQMDGDPQIAVGVTLGEARLARIAEAEAARHQDDNGFDWEESARRQEQAEEFRRQDYCRTVREGVEADRLKAIALADSKVAAMTLLASCVNDADKSENEWLLASAAVLRMGIRKEYLLNHSLVIPGRYGRLVKAAEPIELELSRSGVALWPTNYSDVAEVDLGSSSVEPSLLDRMMIGLRPGKVVVVDKLDQIIRAPIRDSSALLSALAKHGSLLVIPGVVEAHEVDPSNTDQAVIDATQEFLRKMLRQMALDEYEPILIRQAAGINRSMDTRSYKGRQVDMDLHRRVIAFLSDASLSIKKVAQMARCSPTTVAKIRDSQ